MSEFERRSANGGAGEADRVQDEGCGLADSCLRCPFTRCVYEQPHGRRHFLKIVRDREIARWYQSKETSYRKLAKFFGVSVRTVGRAVKGRPKEQSAKRKMKNLASTHQESPLCSG